MNYYFEGLQHIGIPTKKYQETQRFYTNLGFTLAHENRTPSGENVCFLKNGSLILEVYESEDASGSDGAVNHFALDSTDIEKSYAAACGDGQKILSNGIESLNFWENGVKFFIIEGPNAERVEFCQKL